MKIYSKLFSFIFVLAFILTSQVAFAGGGGGGGGGIDWNPFHSTVATVVANVAVDAVNVVVGVAQDVAGVAVGAYGVVFNDDARKADANNLFEQAAGHYERAVSNLSSINNLTSAGNTYIGGASDVKCWTNDYYITAGDSATWNVYGGVVGEIFDFSGSDGFSSRDTKSDINQNVTVSQRYSTPLRRETASVHWSNKSQEGDIDCVGAVMVYSPNDPNDPRNGGKNKKPAKNPNDPNSINGIGDNLAGGNGKGGANGDAFIIEPLCVPAQDGSLNGNIYAGKAMNWNIASKVAGVDFSRFSPVSVEWTDSDTGKTVTTSNTNFTKIYNTIGIKTITINLTGSADNTDYVSSCTATTTVHPAVNNTGEI